MTAFGKADIDIDWAKGIFRMQMTSRILSAVLFTLGALICMAFLDWEGLVVGTVLLALAATVFIESNRWRAWAVPSSCLAFAALSAFAGINYLIGENVYLARSCTGSKKALCDLTDTAMLASGGRLSGLMWLCTACLFVVGAYYLRRHYIKANH